MTELRVIRGRQGDLKGWRYGVYDKTKEWMESASDEIVDSGDK